MAPRSSAPIPLILQFLLLCALAADFDDRISINCGSASPAASLGGREWLEDVYPGFSSSAVRVNGHSTRTSARRLQPIVDPVPYATARISRSRFSYDFWLNPGQKHIRLHFNPTAYRFGSGLFTSLEDYFSVEAGQFTLLRNFSASITARALGLNAFTKEFCVIVRDTLPFSLVFTAEAAPSSSRGFYAFVNGIEIASASSSLSYCHGEDIGVQVVGQKSVIYIDSSSALEVVCRLGVKKKASVFSGAGSDDSLMYRMGAKIVNGRANKVSDNSWKVAVDVGFRYVIRFHFLEMGLNLGGASSEDFMILINGTIAVTNADMLRERVDKGVSWYKSFIVMVNGNKREGKRDIIISLHLKDGIEGGSGSLEGFEVFKLTNHDNSLASPNRLPPIPDSLSHTVRKFLAILGPTNAIATFAVTLVCLASVAVHKLQQSREGNFTEEEIMPLARIKTLCRRFSLAEIQSATDNFSDLLVIGKGGFGKVYKGRIDNGKQTVAVKRLKSSSKQGRREFQTEIELLSELRHVNVVSLIGYCNEDREMILVYEHVPGGSLADHLYKLARKNNTSSYLTWKQRLEICIGAGRGLDYLHTGHRIIHRDIKPSNILLDDNFVAKVADFGLAKIQSGQSQASTNFKGTFGYFDPDYFRTHRFTMKSDTYSFGVVLLEVLCGRPAVERWAEEDKRSITMWGLDKISKGEVDQIVDLNLKDEMSPSSLKAFVRIVERCLHDEPKKRPAIAHVIINLEYALEQQECLNSSAPNGIAGLADVLPLIEKPLPRNVTFLLNEIEVPIVPQQENAPGSLQPNEAGNAADDMPYTNNAVQENVKSSLPTEITVGGTRSQTMTTLENVTSPSKGLFKSRRINAGTKAVIKNTMRRLSRLWPLDAFRSSRKPFNEKESISSIAAPAASTSAKLKQTGGTPSENRIGGELLSSPNFRVFSLAELKAITGNFNTLLGEGGFGKVYKGLLKQNGIGSTVAVAIKKLRSDSAQGLEELLAEVNFLGRLSHPNLVKLLGCCIEERNQLLVYEFVQHGSLEYHLFRRVNYSLPWDMRLKILIGAARGLAFLHSTDRKVIYRDLKAANILLDESYQPKLSDFGLARWGPAAGGSHVSTRVVGTYGYAAPEYVATGHLYLKSDVYSFGVVIIEMMTGLRAIDRHRPPGQTNLVEWIKPLLLNRRKLLKVMDSSLEGRFPASSIIQIAQLAYKCLDGYQNRRPSSEEVFEALEKCQA